MSTFEVYKDKKGETRFRYRANNGEIVFSSEGYKAKASAMKSIESLKKGVAAATVEDMTVAAKPAVKANGKAPGKAAAAKPAAKAANGKAPAKAAAKPAAAKKAKAPAKPRAAAKPKAAAAKN